MESTVNLPFITADQNGPKHLQTTITRTKFEQLIGELLEKTKQPVIDAVLKEQEPMRERAQAYLDDPTLVRNIIEDGCERAGKMASETMRDVRDAMGLGYS